jgi:predicted amino acid racemase
LRKAERFMPTPYLSIDLDGIAHNARCIVDLCTSHGIEVTGVTKGVCGHPAVAQAMLAGGVGSIGDSRMINVDRLRRSGITADLMMLRLPALSRTADIAAGVSVSLHSELKVLSQLSRQNQNPGRPHDVIVMVDLGDLREGVRPGELVAFVGEALHLPGIRIKGLGTNLTCLSGVTPNEANMLQFVELAEDVEARCGITLEWLSAVNSSGLELIASGRMPSRINHARIGEAILLGRETIERRAWPGTHQDAFVLHAEVLECRHKPSRPEGQQAEDAFGGRPEFEDSGERLRALLNVGREDVDIETLTPLDPGIRIVGASSGYLVLDVTDATSDVSVGAELEFAPGYGTLLRAMTSEYVEKRWL